MFVYELKWLWVGFPLAVTYTSDIAPVSSNEFLDIQVTIECGFTSKQVRSMIKHTVSRIPQHYINFTHAHIVKIAYLSNRVQCNLIIMIMMIVIMIVIIIITAIIIVLFFVLCFFFLYLILLFLWSYLLYCLILSWFYFVCFIWFIC